MNKMAPDLPPAKLYFLFFVTFSKREGCLVLFEKGFLWPRA
jgi:hypothetical protein